MKSPATTESEALTTYLPESRLDNVRQVLGKTAEQSANVLTGIRAVGGLALNRYIEATPDYQSWKVAAAFGLLALTDVEGAAARFGRRLQGKDEQISRPLNAYADHLTDKILVNGTMIAIARREAKNGNNVYAGAVGAAAGATVVRDVATTADRLIADSQGLDTRAQKGGKRKALWQYLVTGAALTPLAKSKPAKALLGTAFCYTAKESIKSGWSLHQHFKQKRAERKLSTG